MTMLDATPVAQATETFIPKYPFEFEHASANRFAELVELYDTWHRTEPVLSEPLPLADGWHTIDPQMAEQLLRRNHPGANRKLALATIQYYAGMMRNGEWPKTGQPIIFDESGRLIDGQHRLWAALLAGAAFQTFVVTGVPQYPELFAYIDNCRPRNPAAALQTAGYNGVSATISVVLKIAVEIGNYTPTSAKKCARMSPVEYVRLAHLHPNAQSACRAATSDWEEATSLTGHKEIVGYIGMRILDLYGRETADEFFGQLGDTDGEYPPDGVIMRLRKLCIKDREKPTGQMKRHQLLAYVIQAFNAWVANVDLPKRWSIGVNDDYPVFAVPEGSTDVAEAAE